MAKIRKFLFLSLLIPYTISIIGVFSSSFAFFHRTNFQLSAATSNDNDLQLQIFSSIAFEKIKWTDGRKEFELEGKMYDVARTEKKDDAYFVYCENDSLEDLLLNYFKTAGAKGKAKFIAHVHFFETMSLFVCTEFCRVLHDPVGRRVSLYRSIPHELNTPPPRIP